MRSNLFHSPGVLPLPFQRLALCLALLLLCLAPAAAQSDYSISFKNITTTSVTVVFNGPDVPNITDSIISFSPCNFPKCHSYWAGIHTHPTERTYRGLQVGTTYTVEWFDIHKRPKTRSQRFSNMTPVWDTTVRYNVPFDDLGSTSGSFTTEGDELRVSVGQSHDRITFTFHELPAGARGSIVSYDPRPPRYASARHVFITNKSRGRGYWANKNYFAPNTTYTVTIRAYDATYRAFGHNIQRTPVPRGVELTGNVLDTQVLSFTTDNFTPSFAPPPDPPPVVNPPDSLNLQASGITANSISLSWDDVGAHEYVLSLTGDTGAGAVLNGWETSFTFSGLTAGEEYDISLTAFFLGGEPPPVKEDLSVRTLDAPVVIEVVQPPTSTPAPLLLPSNTPAAPPQPAQQQQQQDPPQPQQPQQQQQQQQSQQQQQDPPQPQQQQAQDPPQPQQQQQEPDPPPPTNTPVPPPTNTPVPPPTNTAVPPPTNTPVPPPPEPEPQPEREKIKLSVSDIGQDSLTASWDDVGDFLYFLQLTDIEAGQHKLAQGEGGRRIFSGLKAGAEYEVLLEVYEVDDNGSVVIDSDSKRVRTAD